MPAAPSLPALVDRAPADLGIAIVAGDTGRAPPLPPSRPGGNGPGVVGRLDLRQPNRIQVLGRTEVDFWNAQAADERAELVERLFGEGLCGIVVSDGLAVPSGIRRRAAAAGVPLACAAAGGERVVHGLRRVLAEVTGAWTVRHGVFLDVLGVGVLLTGEGGVGKSEMALELVSRGHSLVADDAPEFRLQGPYVEGKAPPILRDFLEVGGLGVLNLRAMYGDAAIRETKRLQLIIHLEPLTSALRSQIDRLNGNMSTTHVLATPVDSMTLPVAPGRNLAVLAEAAVRNFLLRRRGYHAAEDLMQRQREQMREDDPCD